MNIPLIVLLIFGQAPVPSNLDKSSFYLQDMPVGARARVYKEALMVDSNGGCWLRGNYVVDNDIYSPANRNKELEIIHNQLGWIVRIHPYWYSIGTRQIRRYPQWTRGIESRYMTGFNIPVKSVVVVELYPQRQQFDVNVRLGLDSFKFSR